jgi:predicted transcriptional regulator
MKKKLKTRSSILNILRSKKRSFSEEEIMEITELKWGTVARTLSDLKDQGLIEGWPSSDEVILCEVD